MMMRPTALSDVSRPSHIIHNVAAGEMAEYASAIPPYAGWLINPRAIAITR